MAAAPYYAPTYFPASYFYAPADPTPISPSAGPTPYYAPTYFPASYFYAPADPTPIVPSAGPTPYNAPTYFPASYFFGGPTPKLPDPLVTPVEPLGLDRAAYSALLGLLRETGAFDEVIFGDPSWRGRAGSGHYPLAVVIPKEWEEVDDYDPAMILRRVSYAIRLVVRADDECQPFDQLDRLTAAVRGVVNRSDLDRSCLPGLTRISSGKYEGVGHYPEWSVDLQGEFTSIVDPAADRAASA